MNSEIYVQSAIKPIVITSVQQEALDSRAIGDVNARVDAEHQAGAPAPKTRADQFQNYTGWLVSHIGIDTNDVASPAHAAKQAAEAEQVLAEQTALAEQQALAEEAAAKQRVSEITEQAQEAIRAQEREAEIARLETVQREERESRLDHYIAAEKRSQHSAASMQQKTKSAIVAKFDSIKVTSIRSPHFAKDSAPVTSIAPKQLSKAIDAVALPLADESLTDETASITSPELAGQPHPDTSLMEEIAKLQNYTAAATNVPVQDQTSFRAETLAPTESFEATTTTLLDVDRAAVENAYAAMKAAQVRIAKQIEETQSLMAPTSAPVPVQDLVDTAMEEINVQSPASSDVTTQEETETEVETESQSEPESEPETEPETAPATEIATGLEIQTETEPAANDELDLPTSPALQIPASIVAWEVDAFRWPETSNMMFQSSLSMDLMVDTVLEMTTKDKNRVAFCGSARCVGTTMVAMSVARLANRRYRKVLLIDADIRKPDMTGLIGLPHGITWLDPASLENPADAVIRSMDTGICVMPMAPLENSATTGNRLDHLGEVTAKLQNEFDLILIDAGPCSQLGSETSHHSRLCDSAVLVHDMYRTEQNVFDQAKNEMVRFGVPKYAIVHNFTQQLADPTN